MVETFVVPSIVLEDVLEKIVEFAEVVIGNGGADNSNADNAAAGSGNGGADIGALEDDL